MQLVDSKETFCLVASHNEALRAMKDAFAIYHCPC